MNRDDTVRAVDGNSWKGTTEGAESRAVSFVYSVRMPSELSVALAAEAQRRGLKPSAMIRELVSEGLSAARDDATVTLRVADLHRAIDTAIRSAA